MQLLPGNFLVVVSALIIGAAIGFVMQRGRYCMNTAFRDVIFINDVTLFRAYILALIIAIIGANVLEDMHWLGGDATGPFTLTRQAFTPVANIVGGYIFGLGIVLASGCGSGILFRVGEGLVSALVAVMGFGAGILMTTRGVLKPVYELLKSYKVGLPAADGSMNYGFSLPDFFGGGMMAKWIIIAVITVAGGLFVLKGKPFKKGSGKGYYWSFTGVLIGVIVVAAWWASGNFGGMPRGISFTGPLSEAILALTQRSSGSAYPMFNLLGMKVTWSALYVLAVPIGAYVSSSALKEFKIQAPPARDIMTVFGGSLMMGFGSATAGG